MIKAPVSPAGTPGYADTISKDLIAWVRALFKQPPMLPSYTVAQVAQLDVSEFYSSASSNAYSKIIFVTNEAGGAVPAFCDGTNFRRVTDRAVVS